jgi:hypothetical protein
MTHTSPPPGGGPNEPNQFTSPCYAYYFVEGRRGERIHFDDLQIAYLWSKEIMDLNMERGEEWIIKSWQDTIELLYEYHMEDRSGIEVAAGPDDSCVIIYYD